MTRGNEEVVLDFGIDRRGGVLRIEVEEGRWTPLLNGDGDYVILPKKNHDTPAATRYIARIAASMRGADMMTVSSSRKGEHECRSTQTG